MINWHLYSHLVWSLPQGFVYPEPVYLSYYNSAVKNENKHYLRDNEDTDFEYIDPFIHSYGSQCRYPYSGVVIGTQLENNYNNYEYPPITYSSNLLDRLGNPNLPAYNHNIHPITEVTSEEGCTRYKTSIYDDRSKYYHLKQGNHVFKMHHHGNSTSSAIYVMYQTPSRKEWNPAELIFTTDKYFSGVVSGLFELNVSLHDTLLLLMNNEDWDYVVVDDKNLYEVLKFIKSTHLPDTCTKVHHWNPLVTDKNNIHQVPLGCVLVPEPEYECELPFSGDVLVISLNNKSYASYVSSKLNSSGSKSIPVVVYGVYRI